MRHITILLFITAACLGCDPLANPVAGRLTFSSDTVSFDTVFSGVGSSTMEFRAINSENDPLLIDHIWLAGGEDSPFRLNINGEPGNEAEEIVLARNDSIFVFVEVTIDPTGNDAPLAIVDSVNFVSGSYAGRVILEACGQDVLIVDEDINDDAVWLEGKPYVIKGSLLIDTLATLTLEPGTRVFFHHGASVTVAGSLHSSGTPEKRVLFASDRLEDVYSDVPGKWKGIRFLDCSRNNFLNFTDVRNGVMAVELAGKESSVPDLILNGTRLMHNTVASLVAHNADVYAVNSVFAHSGFSTVSITEGGNFDFIYCTMESRWEYAFRSQPVMFIGPGKGSLPEVTVLNSVITGTLGSELAIDASAGEASARFRADSSLIKVDTLRNSWYSTVLFRDVLTGPDPRFIDEIIYDFRPDTLSPMLDRAGSSEAVIWTGDIRNKPRVTGDGADIGAFERQPGEKRKEKQ
ncbi:MAG: hypothetical protein WAV93_01070 [Bacteroidales bacterium]